MAGPNLSSIISMVWSDPGNVPSMYAIRASSRSLKGRTCRDLEVTIVDYLEGTTKRDVDHRVGPLN